MKLPNFKFYGRCGHEAKFWFVPHVSKYFVTCARQRDLLNQTCIHMIQKIENRRVRQENIIVIMNISFHHPPIGYFLESYISRSSGKIFPLKWSLLNAQQKKLTKRTKKWKKGEGEEAKGKHREGSVSFKQNILKFFHFSPKLQKLHYGTRNRLKPELF